MTDMERLLGALNISPDDVGRIMHESWSRTKRSQGFHHPSECPNGQWAETARGRAPCPKCHTDLVPWDNLPEPQKDINRHAFDDVLAEIRRRADIAERVGRVAEEAERYRELYEKLRTGVERILKQIEATPKPEEFIPTNPDEMMAELLYAMGGGKGHNKGFADGLWVAGIMLRGLLDEAETVGVVEEGA